MDWRRTSEMVEAEIGRKRDWGTVGERERKRGRTKDVFAREKEK